VTSVISGDGRSIVYSSDLGPDPSQIYMDWEIVHHHIPTGTTTMITETNDRDYDDFYPSISHNGDVMAWTSDFNYITNASITSTNQIFAAKITMGRSRASTASNYHPEPDVEVCCEWDDDSLPEDTACVEDIMLQFSGDPNEMKSGIAFYEGSEEEDEKWLNDYLAQIREDISCNLAIPKQYLTVSSSPEASNWEEDEIRVTLSAGSSSNIMGCNSVFSDLQTQYLDPTSSLWKMYLAKTMNNMPQLCIDSRLAVSYQGSSYNCRQIFKLDQCSVPVASSHCPLSCGSCDQYACEDSLAPVIYQGVSSDCTLLSELSPRDLTRVCQRPLVSSTCRATCGYCSS